jgi:hypothetical protein
MPGYFVAGGGATTNLNLPTNSQQLAGFDAMEGRKL